MSDVTQTLWGRVRGAHVWLCVCVCSSLLPRVENVPGSVLDFQGVGVRLQPLLDWLVPTKLEGLPPGNWVESEILGLMMAALDPHHSWHMCPELDGCFSNCTATCLHIWLSRAADVSLVHRTHRSGVVGGRLVVRRKVSLGLCLLTWEFRKGRARLCRACVTLPRGSGSTQAVGMDWKTEFTVWVPGF